MSEVQHSEREPLLSQQKRFPEVFRWKVAAIIISVLIAIFLVVDIILLVHYNNSQPRKTNYTFIADLLGYSASRGDAYSAQQFINLASALATSYSELWFQSADLVAVWTAAGGTPLGLNDIGGFFDGDSDHQLFLLTLSPNPKKNYLGAADSYLGAAYSHIGFPLPSGNWQDFLFNKQPNYRGYYTFEIADRQSVLVGGGSPAFLRMSGSTADLLSCKVLTLTNASLTFLELFTLNFATPAPAVSASLAATSISAACFEGGPTDALAQLQAILGAAGETHFTVDKIEVFHLSV